MAEHHLSYTFALIDPLPSQSSEYTFVIVSHSVVVIVIAAVALVTVFIMICTIISVIIIQRVGILGDRFFCMPEESVLCHRGKPNDVLFGKTQRCVLSTTK